MLFYIIYANQDILIYHQGVHIPEDSKAVGFNKDPAYIVQTEFDNGTHNDQIILNGSDQKIIKQSKQKDSQESSDIIGKSDPSQCGDISQMVAVYQYNKGITNNIVVKVQDGNNRPNTQQLPLGEIYVDYMYQKEKELILIKVKIKDKIYYILRYIKNNFIYIISISISIRYCINKIKNSIFPNSDKSISKKKPEIKDTNKIEQINKTLVK